MSESKLVNAARVNNKTTHNGMTTNHTSLDACIDMFFLSGASSQMDSSDIDKVFLGAYSQNNDIALRILFWSRDIRGGAGERYFFKTILDYLSIHKPYIFNQIIFFLFFNLFL